MRGRRSRQLPGQKELLSGYLSFIRYHRGLCSVTCRHRETALREFFSYLGNRGIPVSKLEVKDLDEFISHVAERRMSKAYMSTRTAALRDFLRYLFCEGWLEQDLSCFIESPYNYSEATVPPHFAWAELEELIASVKGKSPMALRDKAMLVLFCAYGLRAGEALRLSLDDLDWVHKLLRLRGRKGNSPLTLPLLPVVEAVLADYIHNGRPSDVPCRNLFLKSNGQPLVGNSTITVRVQKLVAGAGLKGGRGAHAIRRAVGTRIVEQGFGLAKVAMILGHESLNSSRVYLRLSMEILREVSDNYGEML